MPLKKLASATCQTSSAPVQASSAKITELDSIEITTMISVIRRSSRSARAPMTAPNKVIGSIRSIVSIATMNGEPVR